MLIYPYTKEKTVPVPRRGEIMRDETKMDVYMSGVTGAEYDAGMKQLMSNKEIIVPILQMTVSEFKTCRMGSSFKPLIPALCLFLRHLYYCQKFPILFQRSGVGRARKKQLIQCFICHAKKSKKMYKLFAHGYTVNRKTNSTTPRY